MLFGTTIFLSAFLLFQVQLITAKRLLPWFGGAPAVWTTCELFFQLVLLAGYAYAHVLATRCTPRRQFGIHLGLLLAAGGALALLAFWGGTPLLAPGALKPSGTESPIPLLLLTLAASVGLPYFALSATGPLLQGWHSRTAPSLHSTYRLYALSNAGSLLGLLSYPFGVERILDVVQQAWVWTALFAVFAVGCAVTAWQGRTDEFPVSGSGGSDDDEPLAAARSRRWAPWLWVLLSFTSSALFLSTTNQLSQEVTVVPFLWVMPLAIYLLTFIVCFDRPAWYSRRWAGAGAMVASGAIALRPSAATVPIVAQVIGYGIFLFFFCMLCHGELVALRPGKRRLTFFYLLIAIGGGLGGAFVSLFAPLLFRGVWELYVALFVGWIVIGLAWIRQSDSPLWVGEGAFFAVLSTVAAPIVVPLVIVLTPLRRQRWVGQNPWLAVFLGGVGLAMVVYALCRRTRFARAPFWSRALLVVMIAMTGKLLADRVLEARGDTVFAGRNFYGLVRVVAAKDPLTGEVGAYKLVHGVTNHGVQFVNAISRDLPTTYYCPSSGVGLAARFASARALASGGHLHIGVLGLGVGTIATYAQPGDSLRFYEIDPIVITLAGPTSPYFSFLRDCAGTASVVPGDARLSLEREASGDPGPRFDLLAVDAFSGDGIPMHLLTVEAFRLYAGRLRSGDSILAVHITNAFLDLEPVVAANAAALGFAARRVATNGADSPLPEPSVWILLSRDPRIFADSAFSGAGVRELGPRQILFTDRYTNLFRVLR